MNRQRVIDLLSAGRVANLPSVVSNVVFGALMGGWLLDATDLNLLWLALSACALYLGGCFLNDWSDRNWDREHKPTRAIPASRLSARGILWLALGCLIAGVSGAFLQNLFAGVVACGIVGAIGVYTWIHKKTVWGILPMGLCRGGLYFLGLARVTTSERAGWPALPDLGPIILLPALGLAAFVAGLSLLARYEAKGKVEPSKRAFAFLLLTLPAFLSPGSWLAKMVLVVLFGGVALFGYRLMKQSIGKGVSFLLASICLVDCFYFLSLLELEASLWPAVGSFVAFLLALLLQRFAPAT